jgi:hypothetical protein
VKNEIDGLVLLTRNTQRALAAGQAAAEAEVVLPARRT